MNPQLKKMSQRERVSERVIEEDGVRERGVVHVGVLWGGGVGGYCNSGDIYSSVAVLGGARVRSGA